MNARKIHRVIPAKTRCFWIYLLYSALYSRMVPDIVQALP